MTKARRTGIAFMLGIAASVPVCAAAESLDEALAGVEATFVAWRASDGTFVRHDEAMAARPVSPCSTFKIPNAWIALDTGVATGPDHVRRFDEARHPREPQQADRRWAVLARDHDLRSAVRESVVWYFQEVAVEIGKERMARYLERFDYGNRDLSSGIDRFWLSASLRISADEQVAFLRRMVAGDLTREPPTAVVRDLLRTDEGDGWALFAKTGMGRTPDGRPLGWWVGWVERADGAVVFAFRIEADDFDTVSRERIRRARRALAAIGALPASDAR